MKNQSGGVNDWRIDALESTKSARSGARFPFEEEKNRVHALSRVSQSDINASFSSQQHSFSAPGLYPP